MHVLRKINQYMAPSAKLRVLCAALDTLFEAIQQVYTSEEDQNSDTTLPSTMLLLLRSNPRNLASNLKYIRTWCSESVSSAKTGFLFTTFEAALTFLQRCNSVDGLHVNSSKDFHALLHRNSVDSGRKLSVNIIYDYVGG